MIDTDNGIELTHEQMFALPFTSMSAAHVHEAGMTQWLLSAGPRSINTDFALQVFHDVRWCIVCH